MGFKLFNLALKRQKPVFLEIEPGKRTFVEANYNAVVGKRLVKIR
jgi:hypothetical protein